MPAATPKVKMSKDQFELLCQKIYQTFLSHLEEKEVEKIKARIGTSSHDWKRFFTPNYLFESEEIPTLKADFEIFFQNRFQKIVQDVNGETPHLQYGIPKVAHATAYYLHRKWVPSGRVDESSDVILGGSKKWPERHYDKIFFEYIGYKDYEEFIKAENLLPASNQVETEFTKISIDFHTTFLKREKELDYELWEQLEGNWTIDALEDEINFSKEKIFVPLGETLDDQLKGLHKKPLEYDFRYGYQAEVQITKTSQKGVFLFEGTIKTATIGKPEKDEWEIRALGMIRKTDLNEKYICFDYEMIPNKYSQFSRTFGYAMGKPSSHRTENKRFDGFYLSNRRRFDGKNEDETFQFGISAGRFTLRREASTNSLK